MSPLRRARSRAILYVLLALSLSPSPQVNVSSAASFLSRIQQTLRGESATGELQGEQPWYRQSAAQQKVRPCRIAVDETQSSARLDNGFVELEIDLRNPRVRTLRSDPSGYGRYGQSLFATSCGFALERQDVSGHVFSSCHAASAGRIHRHHIRQTSEVVHLTLFDVVDDELSPVAREQWHFTLHRGARTVDLRTNGTLLQSTQLTALRHAFALTAPSIYGLYDRGVVQMMRADSSAGFYASRVLLRRVYMLGGDGAHAGSVDFTADGGIAVDLGSDGAGVGQTVLVSDRQGVFSSTLHSGEHLVTGDAFLVSPSRKFYARVESGALVVARYVDDSTDEIIWQTGPVWPSHNDKCTLVLQEDSNLVLYGGTPETLGKVLWSSGTKFTDGNSMLYLDNKGRLSLYPSDHIRGVDHKMAMWSSSQRNGWQHIDHHHRSDYLLHGEMLYSGGAALVSQNGLFAAALQQVGDQLQLAVRVQDHHDRSAVVWISDAPSLRFGTTVGSGSFVLQDDGNAVIYWRKTNLLGRVSADLGEALWHSGSHGETRGDYFFQMQNDGYLVLGAGDIASGKHAQVWTSGSKLSNLLRPGESMDSSRILLSNDMRFVATLADDQVARAGLAVLFFDGTEYLTVSAFGASSSEKPCEAGLPIALLMQKDGNLVLTRDEPVLVQHGNGKLQKETESVVVWTSDTHGNPGMALALRDDGSLAIGQFQAGDDLGTDHLWSSTGVSERMRAGDSLEEGYCLLSSSGEYSAVVEVEGRFVVYHYSGDHQHRLGSAISRSEHWCVATRPTQPSDTETYDNSDEFLKHSLVLQPDGDLVFVKHRYDSSEVIFSTGTSADNLDGSHASAQRELILTDRGDLQLVETTLGETPTVIWTSASDVRHCAGSSRSTSSSSIHEPSLPTKTSTSPMATGLQRVIVGKVPTEDQWSDGWATSQPAQTVAGMTWSSNLRITPNSKNFPMSYAGSSFLGHPEDFETAMVGIWATAVGCLTTSDNGVVRGRRIAVTSPTLATPSRGYADLYSFMDPDTYFALSAILVSGDTYLLEQARDVLEFSASHQSGEGQLPHHFEKDCPRFEAISGAQQSGPTIFWILSSLEYVKYSGDAGWLKKMLPRLRHAVNFCMRTLHHKPSKSEFGHGLVHTNGSLLIDTFIRGNFSSDTNVMLAGFLLPEMADAEESTGNSSGAHNLRRIARHLSDAINAKLWHHSHYVTQLNLDGSVVDMVDYDANLIAIAGGVAANIPGRPSQIMRRIDNGGNGCAAWGSSKGGPQWVSERWYGPERTHQKNIGDSWCGMARIAYFDALSRIATGRSDLFDAVLNRLSDDLLTNTWLPERYGCSGHPQRNRTAFFFEYPSVISLMVAQMRYGIRLGMRAVSIRPSSEAPQTFLWHVGAGTTQELRVEYSQTTIAAVIPGILDESTKQSVNLMHRDWTIHGMSPKGLYTVDVDAIEDSGFAKSCYAAKASAKWKRKTAVASGTGVLQFAALTVQGCEVRVERRRHGLHVDET